MKDSSNNCTHDEEEVKKGRANPEFVKRHDSSENSHPADWFKLLLSNRVGETTKCGTDTWNNFTNLKGLLPNLGHQGRIHLNFNHSVRLK